MVSDSDNMNIFRIKEQGVVIFAHYIIPNTLALLPIQQLYRHASNN